MANFKETKTQVVTTEPTLLPPTSTQRRSGRGFGGRRGRGGPGGSQFRGANTPDAPPPAIVPPPGTARTGSAPTPYSGTPTFTAWGPSPVQQSKRQIRQPVSLDAAGYEDLIDGEYKQMTAKHVNSGRKIPRSLFKYLCFMAWWHRAFFLKLANNNRVSAQEREAMRVLDSLAPHVSLPSRIKEYLRAMGNFDHTDGQRIEIIFPDFDLTSSPGSGDARGFVTFQPNNSRRVTPATSFIYGRYPIPGIIAGNICHEYDFAENGNLTFTLRGIAPTPESFGHGAANIVPTNNIVGWDVPIFAPLHGSWASTMSSLGWNTGGVNSLGLPPDALSNWLISPGSLRWVSDSLRQIQNYPLSPLTEVNSSLGGAYLQLSYLELYPIQEEPTPPIPVLDEYKATLHYATVLKSAKPIAYTHLGPAIACGFRRNIVFSTYHGVANTTLSATWFATTANQILVPFPPDAIAAANAEFNAPGTLYNADTYETAPSTRSLVLNSVLL